MKHLDKVGFVLCLIGFGGLAEAYGFNKSFAISLVMIITGGILIAIGDTKDAIEDYKHSDDIDSRPYFLN